MKTESYQARDRINTEKLGGAALILVLIGVGAFAWWLELQPPLVPKASALATLPTRIGPWRSQSIALDSTVEAVLRADFDLQRVYTLPTGEKIWLYLAITEPHAEVAPSTLPGAATSVRAGGSRRREHSS